MAFPHYPHNEQGFPHRSFSSHFRTDIPSSQHREVEVLRLVTQGMTNVQVAEQLDLSPHALQGQLCSIYQKIQVKSRRAATRYAIERQLV